MVEASARRSEIKKELASLVAEGLGIVKEAYELHEKKKPIIVHERYQAWYSLSLKVVRLIAVDRYSEFLLCYDGEKNRKNLTVTNYGVRDFLLGNVNENWHENTSFACFFNLLQSQCLILKSAYESFDKKINNIVMEVRYEVWDSDLDVAKELIKIGQLRAAGAIAGVIVENHLGIVADGRGIKVKKNPTIADLNDALKASEIYDTPMWRFVQRLADIRNLSVHKKDREPTRDEIQDLISGVEKITAEIV